MDGEKIFTKIKKGDIKAYNQLFKVLYAPMCSFAQKYVKDQDLSRDIAQNAFINFWNKKEKYDSISSLKSFLYVCVKNLCLNHLRDTQSTITLDEFSEISTDTFFQNSVIEEETVLIIEQAISNLSPQSSKIMKLVMQGVKNKEISEILNISVATVKTLKYNSLAKLKEDLKEYYWILILFFIEN